MFKEKINLRVITLFSIAFFMVIFGACAKGPVMTDNDVLLPESFVNVYMIMDYSKQLSEVTGKLTNDLLQRGLITKEDKADIGDVWKEHKKYSNRLQKEVDIWYNDIKYGDGKFDKTELFAILERLIGETELITKLLGSYVGEENAILISNINNRMLGIYSKIEGE